MSERKGERERWEQGREEDRSRGGELTDAVLKNILCILAAV